MKSERPFYQFGVHIPIERISELDLTLYVRGRFDGSGVAIRSETAAQIVRLAGCHPHFVQYFASEVWNLLGMGCRDDDHLLHRLVDRVVSAQDTGFGMFFDGLSAAQRRVLVDLAVHGGHAVLAEQRRVAGNLGSASTVASALEALARMEIVARRGSTWAFVNPAFELWVRERIARPS